MINLTFHLEVVLSVDSSLEKVGPIVHSGECGTTEQLACRRSSFAGIEIFHTFRFRRMTAPWPDDIFNTQGFERFGGGADTISGWIGFDLQPVSYM